MIRKLWPNQAVVWILFSALEVGTLFAVAQSLESNSGKIVELAPGLRIDWGRKRVEVDCKVVLREGLLEFVLCSPQTKEHESILVTSVRPLHIFQALGMIGLEPGAPPSYDSQRRKSIPAKGAALAIQVKRGTSPAVPIEEWLWEVNGKRPAPPQHWVFAGSTQSAEHGFAADVEGTIVAVVDFSTSLISIAEPHTESNDQLWLGAHTRNVPALGTKCTVIIQAEESCVLRLNYEDDQLFLNGHPVHGQDLQMIVRDRKSNECLTRVEIHAAKPLNAELRTALLKQIETAGVAVQRVRFVESVAALKS